MTDIEFERMLSIKPRTGEANFMQYCIRDLIFNYFEEKFSGDVLVANKHTKEYTDYLFAKMVHRKT